MDESGRRFEVRFADEAGKELRELGPSAATELLRVIAKKLTSDPERYGASLSRELAGYYRLAVRRWRVVYHVDGCAVLVLVLAVGKRAEGDREDIYRGLSREDLDDRRDRTRKG